MLSYLSFLCCFLFSLPLFSQAVITGRVGTQEGDYPLAGVLVALEGLSNGVLTDAQGEFTLITDGFPPLFLEFSKEGYEGRRIKVLAADQVLRISLGIRLVSGGEIIVSASKMEESLLRSPTAIERLEAKDLRYGASFDMYAELANVKGVQMNSGGMNFTAINTRGFADMQNWRFIQLIDGIDMNIPGNNYGLGNLSLPSDLDLAAMELVPGAGSALYGANAFNGILNVTTKDPFLYQGLSAELRTGFTRQTGRGLAPMGSVGLRYAKALNERLAFKLSSSLTYLQDWEANDESFRVSPNLAAINPNFDPNLIPSSAPFFDAVHRYGDERALLLPLGDSLIRVSRTGIAERDLVDYNQKLVKLHAGFHYKLKSDLTLKYDFRFIFGDAFLRHTTTYPMRNTWQQVHHAELKGKRFWLKGYYSGSNTGDSYFLLGTGAFILNGLKPDSLWARDYITAFEGGVVGVANGNHQAARTYADRDVAGPETEAFQNLLRQSLQNSDVRSGGSLLVDRTSFIHLDGHYDLSAYAPWLSALNAGGSLRRYQLNSGGALFNDGPLGFNAPIPILEWGAYVQAGRDFWENRLQLRASARYDKNQNYRGRITPRASAVLALDKKQEQYLRFTYQTGFRNPANQETYIALDIGDAVLLGGVLDNINNYRYALIQNNPLTGQAAGSIVQGSQIFNNLVTLASFQAFQQTGNPALLVPQNINPLLQEQLATYELGYRALFQDRLYLDLAVYYNTYRDFVTRINTFSPDMLRVVALYTNVSEKVEAYGAVLGLEYRLGKGYKISANYSYAEYEAQAARAANPGFLPGFNTPRHRFNLGLAHRAIYKNLGFNCWYRWSESYLWESPFGVGQLPSYQVLDLGLTYRFTTQPVLLKMGLSNLLAQDYRQVYGGPSIGSQYFLTLQYDPITYAKMNAQPPSFEALEQKTKSQIPVNPEEQEALPPHQRF